jgi:hypothetical protein
MSEFMPLLPEWYLVIGALALLSAAGALWAPLLVALPLLVVGIAGTLFQALLSALKPQAVSGGGSRTREAGLRALTAGLYLAQPLARLVGRLRAGLTPWRRRGAGRFVLPIPRSCALWSEHGKTAEGRLSSIEKTLKKTSTAVIRGGDYDRWDLEVRGGPLGSARLLLAVEEHGGGRQLARFRLWPRVSRTGAVVVIFVGALFAASALSGAWAAAALLGGAALLLALRELQECATGIAAAVEAIGLLPEES